MANKPLLESRGRQSELLACCVFHKTASVFT